MLLLCLVTTPPPWLYHIKRKYQYNIWVFHSVWYPPLSSGHITSKENIKITYEFVIVRDCSDFKINQGDTGNTLSCFKRSLSDPCQRTQQNPMNISLTWEYCQILLSGYHCQEITVRYYCKITIIFQVFQVIECGFPDVIQDDTFHIHDELWPIRHAMKSFLRSPKTSYPSFCECNLSYQMQHIDYKTKYTIAPKTCTCNLSSDTVCYFQLSFLF